MEPFKQHVGKAAVLDWTDVNTDLIIPARYLKRIERTGYGPLLFADKRYAPGSAPSVEDPESGGAAAPEFPLNRPEAEGASVLVVGRNFGCGSSREHAVWAIAQAGFRALIAPGKDEGFADIFEGNAANNGLLPIELPETDWSRVADACRDGGTIAVDLESKRLEVRPSVGEAFAVEFEVPEVRRERLMAGLDAISETLLLDESIRDYEAAAPDWMSKSTSGRAAVNGT